MLDLPAAKYLVFTGKGGVGKTSLACAAALALADAGQRVLLVSTDPASNLDEMLGLALDEAPRPVPGAPGLWATNIDPDRAADAYRDRAIASLRGATDAERATRREELSGACTTEVAVFDAFAALFAPGPADGFDRVILDTAPTGHTLRLLSLPRAWGSFLAENERGASCLGPHTALKLEEERFRRALATLADPARTAVVLVARPEASTLREAERTRGELAALGLRPQRLLVNAVFHASDPADPVARALEARGAAALAAMPPGLAALPRDEVPLRSFDTVGLDRLRALVAAPITFDVAVRRFEASLRAPPSEVFCCDSPASRRSCSTSGFGARVAAPRGAPAPAPAAAARPAPELPTLRALVDALEAEGPGLVLVMGKGGVGKTTLAAAIALALADRGHPVRLSTTDPAAHLAGTLEGRAPGLAVERIDPRAETEAYVARAMARRGAHLDADGRALLLEDLKSPCTEEVAVFHAFARIVLASRHEHVVLDTAPTGHTLMLLDATGSYHREAVRGVEEGRLSTPLTVLRDPAVTRVIVAALAETTPVSEAAALQADLQRAGVEPWAWIANATLAGSGTRDPLLAARIDAELAQLERIRGLSRRLAVVPWVAEPPVGVAALRALTA